MVLVVLADRYDQAGMAYAACMVQVDIGGDTGMGGTELSVWHAPEMQ